MTSPRGGVGAPSELKGSLRPSGLSSSADGGAVDASRPHSAPSKPAISLSGAPSHATTGTMSEFESSKGGAAERTVSSSAGPAIPPPARSWVPLVSVFIALALVGVALAVGGADDQPASPASGQSPTGTHAGDGEVSAGEPTESMMPRPLDAPTASLPPSDTPPATAPGWDLIASASIPSLCGHPPTTLVDGKHTEIAEGQGFFELLQGLESGAPGFVSGLPGAEVGTLTAAVASCSAGGVGWPNVIVLFSPGGAFYGAGDLTLDEQASNWNVEGMAAPGREGVTELRVEGMSLVVTVRALVDSDAECCPSAVAEVRAHAEAGRLTVDEITRIDAGPVAPSSRSAPDCSPLVLGGSPCDSAQADEIMAEFAKLWGGGGDWQSLVDGIAPSNLPDLLPTDVSAYSCDLMGSDQIQCDFTAASSIYYSLLSVGSMKITWIQQNDGF